MTAYIPREIHVTAARALKIMPVVVITGMRQTGKTTFLQNDPLFKNYRYVTLDDFGSLQTARTQPEALVASADRMCIDEAQKAPELLVAIKREVDRRRMPGRFILSGSANFSLLKSISESLAGRSLYLTMHSFSRRELRRDIQSEPFLIRMLHQKNKFEFDDVAPIEPKEILRGGMPSVQKLPARDADVWFRGFEQTYVERDIRDIARVEDPLGFRTIVQLSALRTGQILNLSQLSRDTKLSLVTTTRYLQLAETAFLFNRIAPFLRNRSTRLIKSPKLYVADSGLASHLSGVEQLTSNEHLRGVLFETYVLQNILALLNAHMPDARVSYWHVQGRHEVDFIIEYKNTCIAVEIKSASRWSENDLKSLRIFMEQTPSCRAGILAYNGSQTAKIGANMWAIPISKLLR